MAGILCIESATEVCSVALFIDGALVSLRESEEKNVHSSRLTTFMEETVREAGMGFHDLDAVAVSMGPGSYTGLRIGVAAAKGMCYAADRPLIAVPTLQAMALGMAGDSKVGSWQSAVGSRRPGNLLFCPMIDARRMEVYCGLYDRQGGTIRQETAEVIGEESFSGILHNNVIVFGGSGARKCEDVLGHSPNARFLSDFRASARYMGSVAHSRYRDGRFENTAYFEPFYLKDFVAGKPRVKGLH